VLLNPLEREKAYAEEGSVIAQRKLAWFFRNGTYQFRLWEDADGEEAEDGYLDMWICVQGEPQYPEALKWLRKAAEQGDCWDQLELGLMYRDVQGELQNYPEAFHWISKAAEQDSVAAQYELGVMYRDASNYGSAVRWFRRAAERGFVDAQFALGVMYDKGQGVPQNYIPAHMWFNLASAYSHSASEVRDEAACRRDLIASKMSPPQIAEAEKLASEWKPK
jgi:uncharacterized protein